ncbi:MAG: MvdC/MvdD family ATP grasp protein, partial [Pseudonocardiaceae bacterium]
IHGPRVLVLTAPVDPTADMVLTHLHSDGVAFLRLDTAQFPTEITLTGEIGQHSRWHAALNGVSLDEVETIYYRRPGRFEFDVSIPLDMVSWCEGQARFGFWGVLESLPATWINTPTSVHRAEYKPRQLAHATAAGLTVPPTLITNDPHAVADFAARQPHGIITKTLYARMPRTEDGRLSGVVYTNDVPTDRYRDPTITTTAHLFQATLVQKTDLRVTVVGDKVFATEITNAGELDWRRSDDNTAYRPHELPDAVEAGVRRLMRSLDLFFGALDFILTDQGYQFIEINPNGQWGWIEHRTGQPISRALATALKGTPA